MSKNLITTPEIFSDVEYYLSQQLSHAVLFMELHKKKPLDDSKEIPHIKKRGGKSIQLLFHCLCSKAEHKLNNGTSKRKKKPTKKKPLLLQQHTQTHQPLKISGAVLMSLTEVPSSHGHCFLFKGSRYTPGLRIPQRNNVNGP